MDSPQSPSSGASGLTRENTAAPSPQAVAPAPNPWHSASRNASVGNSPPQAATPSLTPPYGPITSGMSPTTSGSSMACVSGLFLPPPMTPPLSGATPARTRPKKRPPALIPSANPVVGSPSPNLGPNGTSAGDTPPQIALPPPGSAGGTPSGTHPHSGNHLGIISLMVTGNSAHHSPTSAPPSVSAASGSVYFTDGGRVLHSGEYAVDESGCLTLTNHLMFNSSFNAYPTLSHFALGPSVAHYGACGPSSATSTASSKHFGAFHTGSMAGATDSYASRRSVATGISPKQPYPPTPPVAPVDIPATPPLKSTNMEEPLSPITYTLDMFPAVGSSASAAGPQPPQQPSPHQTSRLLLLPPSATDVQPQRATQTGGSLGSTETHPSAVANRTTATPFMANDSIDSAATNSESLHQPAQIATATASPKTSPAMSAHSHATAPASGGTHRALLSMHDLEITGCIDSGASGTVFKACHRETGRLFAVKRIDLSSMIAWAQTHNTEARPPPKIRQMHSIVHRELHMLHSEYRSAHVVKTYNAFYSPRLQSLDIVMEYMDYGSLERLGFLMSSTDKRAPLPERVLAVVAEQVLLGLRDMHQRGHVHRDVKPSNTLINAAGVVKLSDFGLSETTSKVGGGGLGQAALGVSGCDADADQDAALCSGTDLYMSPERTRGEPHGPPSDIWALGLSLAECAVGRYPIDLSRCRDEFERMQVMSDGPRYPPNISLQLSLTFKDFVAQCMAKDPRERPTAVQLLDHPLLSQWKGTFNFSEFLRDRVRAKHHQRAEFEQQRRSAESTKYKFRHQFDEDYEEEFDVDEYGDLVDADEFFEQRGKARWNAGAAGGGGSHHGQRPTKAQHSQQKASGTATSPASKVSSRRGSVHEDTPSPQKFPAPGAKRSQHFDATQHHAASRSAPTSVVTSPSQSSPPTLFDFRSSFMAFVERQRDLTALAGSPPHGSLASGGSGAWFEPSLSSSGRDLLSSSPKVSRRGGASHKDASGNGRPSRFLQ